MIIIPPWQTCRRVDSRATDWAVRMLYVEQCLGTRVVDQVTAWHQLHDTLSKHCASAYATIVGEVYLDSSQRKRDVRKLFTVNGVTLTMDENFSVN